MRAWGPFLFSIILGVALAVIAILPPSPKSTDAPAAQFSAARAMEDVRIIAAEPHPTGSTENAEVRAYLLNRLDALGLETFETQGELPERALARLNRWSGAKGGVTNLRQCHRCVTRQGQHKASAPADGAS